MRLALVSVEHCMQDSWLKLQYGCFEQTCSPDGQNIPMFIIKISVPFWMLKGPKMEESEGGPKMEESEGAL